MIDSIFTHFNPDTGQIDGRTPKARLLSSLREMFLDKDALDQTLLQQGDIPIYSVTSVEPANGDGQLHYGIGIIQPGMIGQEYFFTAGHFHAYRPAAELYIGLSGEGLMLLQDEGNGESEVRSLTANTTVYVPGFTAHRTINTGNVPLTYIGVYPSQAGHDYGEILKKNFRKVVIEINGKPEFIDRQIALEILKKER